MSANSPIVAEVSGDTARQARCRPVDSPISGLCPANRLEALRGRAGRAVQHPHQRPVANLLPLAGGITGSGRSRNRGLSLNGLDTMSRTPIHPGEHLAEELQELGISAAELAREIRRADEPRDRHPERTAAVYGRHGAAARALVRHLGRILAQAAKAVRAHAPTGCGRNGLGAAIGRLVNRPEGIRSPLGSSASVFRQPDHCRSRLQESSSDPRPPTPRVAR